MILKGKFKDITNTHTYYVQIGDIGQVINIDDQVTGGNQVMFSGNEPVRITSDMSDTFEHVYIREASINLISNFDLRDYVVASNYLDIPVLIRYDGENDNAVIFSGYVIPLQYNQNFAEEWNEFSVDCVDRLGTLEYIQFPNLFPDQLANADYDTPRSFIERILNNIGFFENPISPAVQNLFYNISYDHTADTKINPVIFRGASPDDWMDCKEVLNQIGTIYGCYFWQDGDSCKVENSLYDMLHSATTPFLVSMDDYNADDTNVSVQEAYNRIKMTVDVSTMEDDFFDPFDDDYLLPVGDKPERVLTELIYNNKGEKMNNLLYFANLCFQTPNIVNWNASYSNDANIEVYDNYCSVLRNENFKFKTPNYLDTVEYGGAGGSTGKNVVNVLKWLYQNPGRAAFLEFGKTPNLWDPKNHQNVIQLNDMKKQLMIQVNSDRKNYTSQQWNNIGSIIANQIDQNQPVCAFAMNDAVNLVPNDKSTINYLVISGKITLNPIIPKTGPFPDLPEENNPWPMPNPHDAWDIDEPDWNYAWNFWARGYNTLDGPINSACIPYWNVNLGQSAMAYIYAKSTLLYDRCIRKDADDEGKYFQIETWTNIDPPDLTTRPWPYNQTPDLQNRLALPYLSPKYEFFKYSASGYDRKGNAQEVDTVDKISVLACELKIGDKYLVEDFDAIDYVNWKTTSKYIWCTEAECPTKVVDGQTVKQKWFTLSINPAIGDAILGKEFSILNNVDLSMNIDAKGTAIPIPYSANLHGRVTFKILGPYNSTWDVAGKVKHGWLFWKHYTSATTTYPILAYVENIIISDLSMKLYSNNGGHGEGKGDNDLVYWSSTVDEYISEKEMDSKFCTALTSDQVASYDIEYNLNNSSILDSNDDPWLGMDEYDGQRYIDDDDKMKLEAARVTEQFNLWYRPRKIIETTLKLRNPENAYDKNNYKFSYLKYNPSNYQIYRTVGREIDLKMNSVTCTMKEISDKPSV